MIPMRELVSHSIGGGWGEDIHADGTEQVAIIRGADFPGVAVGDTSAIPRRWESTRKLPQRTLQAGDIVLESSGGTSDRPTGRTVFISEQLLDRFDVPVIPASFCRLVRIDPSMADPHYVYWWLQGMYADGRTWGYQNRSTGIANFQFQHFLDAEKVSLPTPDEQRAIAATLGALDHKIESNRRAISLALTLALIHVDRMTHQREKTSYRSDMSVSMGAAFKGEFFTEPGIGRPLLRIRDLKTFESQTWTTEERSDETLVRPGDVLVGMDAEFRATLWLGGESVLNQRVCAFRGAEGVSRAFVLRALEPELDLQEQAKTGTTVIHLNKSDIETFRIPALSNDEHRELSALTEPLIKLAVSRAAENKTLARQRDTLLPELLSVRIRVPVEGVET